ncbi:DNA repair protein RecN [Bacillaceae bacterium]
MLVEISIRNFALIDTLQLSFQKGLNILTGETGAGKSIIIDAIGQLAGQRASAEFVRHGADKAEVEGLFEIPPAHPVTEHLQAIGIELEEDGMLVIRREISKQGKNICRINGRLVTQAMLKEIGPWLVGIHGQHHNTALLFPERHVDWLDAYGGENLQTAKKEFAALYGRYKSLKLELERLAKSERELAQRLDLLQYQLQEIVSAELTPGEDERLLEERKKLANVEKLSQGLATVYEALYGDSRALDWLGHAQAQLETIVQYDRQLQEILSALETAFYQLEDMKHELRRYRESFAYDPDRLQEIERRLETIHALKRKYGRTVDEILEYAAAIEDELETIQDKDARIQQLDARLREVSLDLAVEARELSERRKKAAENLTRAVENELKELHMEKTKFSVVLQTVKDEEGIELDGEKIRVTSKGIDSVEFMISPNPGEPLRPLAKIASGGELSRLMLALKAILADIEQVGTLIFDEIDTGVSGRAAQAIARKLAKLAKNQQVICITHLPQVACMADAHYLIYKETDFDKTFTRVRLLHPDEQVLELARMLGGVEVTSVTRKHAAEMLKMAREIREAI